MWLKPHPLVKLNVLGDVLEQEFMSSSMATSDHYNRFVSWKFHLAYYIQWWNFWMNNRHIGGRNFVKLSLSRRLTSKPHPSTPRYWGVWLDVWAVWSGQTCSEPTQDGASRLMKDCRCRWVTTFTNISPVVSQPLSLYSLQSFGGTLFVVQSLEVVHISEVENVLVLW